jgi:putative oxidoreductase
VSVMVVVMSHVCAPPPGGETLSMTLGAPLLRGVTGALFVGHGTQKLFGWFDGPGLEGVKGMMESLELRPPKRHAVAAGLAETAGGALLLLGALTPFATTALTATMVTAIRKVHADKGPWVTGGGYEYNLVLIAVAAGIALSGPGGWSLDALFGWDELATGWRLAAVALGLVAGLVVAAPAVSTARASAGNRAAAAPAR